MADAQLPSSQFDANVKLVNDLVAFDDKFLIYLRELVKLHAERLAALKTDAPRLAGQNLVNAVESVRQNASLKPYFESIQNQCVVLLVSYLSSALGDIFRLGLRRALVAPTLPKELAEVEVRVHPRRLLSQDSDAIGSAIDLFIDQTKDISFQDMQATVRSFRDYLGVAVSPTPQMNDVILGHAARHAIIHAAGVVDRKMQKQIAAASPRTLKRELSLGDAIQFSPAEIGSLATSMQALVRAFEEPVLKRWPSTEPA